MLNKQFYSPKSIEELAKLLAYKHMAKDVFFVAGGTDFAVTAKKNHKMDYIAIDLTKIEEMKSIQLVDKYLEIGACVTLTELMHSALVQTYVPGLAQAASKIGSVQIRNRGTIGGNIANAAQCADTLPVLFSTESYLVLYNQYQGTRELWTEDFVVGFGHTNIQDDEVLYKIRVPIETSRFDAFSKVGSRKTVTISKMNFGMSIQIEKDIIKKSRIYIGSIGPKPVSAKEMEAFLVDKKWDDSLLEKLYILGAQKIESTIPTRPSKHYKKVAIKGVIAEAFNQITDQMEVGHESSV